MPGTKNTAHPDTNSHIGMCSFSIEPTSEKEMGKCLAQKMPFRVIVILWLVIL